MSGKSVVHVMNGALLRLGKDTISAYPEPSTDMGRKLAQIWEIVVEGELESYDWTFARARAALARDAEPPVNEWKYKYAQPDDCISVRRVFPYGVSGTTYGISYGIALDTPRNVPFTIPYIVEGSYILTNYDDSYGPLHIRYTFLNLDPSTWCSDFCDMVSIQLALRLALAYKQPLAVKQDLAAEYQSVRQGAEGSDAAQDYVQDDESMDNWVNAGRGPAAYTWGPYGI